MDLNIENKVALAAASSRGLALAFAEKGTGTTKDFYAAIEQNVPMGRIGIPKELAYTVAFLASEGAAYITGTAVQVDGGFIKGLY
jgi:3-oxoacyl-[acyl-carrier protein] reductase